MATAQAKHKPEASDSTSKGRSKSAEVATAIGTPAYMGGSQTGLAAPAFLQRLPQDPIAEIGTPEAEPEEEDAAAILQPKLQINNPNDSFEAEADGVAARVTGAAPNAAAPVSAAPSMAQRKCATCGGEHDGEEPCPDCATKAQRKESSVRTPANTSPAAKVIAAPGAGCPLGGEMRAAIEPELGSDLSNVRVHNDHTANEAAGAINAKAFTHGDHIWLGRGERNDDLGLIAHEATHTVQQKKGGGKPNLIQRAPADHVHPEDGAAPLGRLNGSISEDVDTDEAVDPNAPKPEIDPAEKAAQKAKMSGKEKPDVDRPAAEAPSVQQAAAEVQAEVDAPAEPVAQGDSGGGGLKCPSEMVADAIKPHDAEINAAIVQAAEADPLASTMINPIRTYFPTNKDGEPTTPDVQGEATAQYLNGQLQATITGALNVRAQARQEKANAAIMRENIAIVDEHVTDAEGGLAQARAQAEFRGQIVDQAEAAYAVSEEKASTVAAEAPGFEAEADEAKEESGPMASEASDSAAQNEANTPQDDPEAAAKSSENSGQLNSVASDSASMDNAASATKARAAQLAADAVVAKEKNAKTQGNIDESRAALETTTAKITEMDGETAQARGEVDAVKAKPDELETKAQEMEDGAGETIDEVLEMNAELDSIQRDYQNAMEQVPGTETLTKNNPAPQEAAQTSVAGQTEAATGAPMANAGVGGGAATAGATGAAGAAQGQQGGYNDRGKVNLESALFGTPTLTPEQQARQQAAEQRAREQRAARLAQLESQYGANLEGLSAWGKAGIALSLTRDSLFGDVAKMGWPSFSASTVAKTLCGLFDPCMPLKGVLGGLSTIASGFTNLFDAEQWAKDPLGNLLKSAADIATGLTVVLGSIAGLAGVISLLMAALIVVTLGWASPVAGPIMTFCGNLAITIGGWTISVGLLALQYQAMLFIKNLVDAMTAETAEELLTESEQMTADVKAAGEVATQVVTARLGQVGGKAPIGQVGSTGAAAANATASGLRREAFRNAAGEIGENLVDAAIEGAAGEQWGGVVGLGVAGARARQSASGGGGDAPTPDANSRSPDAPDAPNTPQPTPDAPTTDAATPNTHLGGDVGGAPKPAEGAMPQPRPEAEITPAEAPEARSREEAADNPEAGDAPDGPTEGGDAPASETSEGGGGDSGGGVQTARNEGPDANVDNGGAQALADQQANRAKDGDAPARDMAEANDTPRTDEASDSSKPPRDGDALLNPAEATALRQESANKSLDQMSTAEKRAESDAVNAAPKRDMPEGPLRDMGLTKEVDTPEGRRFGKDEEAGVTCRLSNTGCTNDTDSQTDLNGRPAQEHSEQAKKSETEPDPTAESPPPLTDAQKQKIREGTVADKDGNVPVIEAAPGKEHLESGTGSLEHKKGAWERYMSEKGSQALPYEAWSTKYDTLDKIRDTANAEARDYNQRLLDAEAQKAKDGDVDFDPSQSGHEKVVDLAGEKPVRREGESDESFQQRQDAYKQRQEEVKREVESTFRELEAAKKDKEGDGNYTQANLDDLAKKRTERRVDGLIVSKEKGAPVPLLPTRRAVEYKAGDVSRTDKILMEAARDIVLARAGYRVEWVIAGHISAPMKKVLTDNKIIVIELNPKSSGSAGAQTPET